MGVKEFETSLANFNQEQIDEIQAAVDAVQAAVDAIQHTDLSSVSDRIGTAADASTVLTLFGKLAKIISDTSGLNGKVGTNADASGTTTLFARLEQLKGYFNNTVIPLIGTKVDAVGTTTLFARAAQAYAFLLEITTKAGTNTDAAGSSTLFARARQAFDYYSTIDTRTFDMAGKIGDPASSGPLTPTIVGMIGRMQSSRPQMSDFVNSAATANTWYTVVNVTGQGRLYKVYAYNDNGQEYASIRITINGGTPLVLTPNAASARATDPMTRNAWTVSYPVEFYSSLKVEINNVFGSARVLSGGVDYGIV